jgi:palmitoyltransferase ZDHHC9/14/18
MQVFFLDGRVICGPDPRGLILTAMATLLAEWIFLCYVVDPSSAHPALVSSASLVLLATVGIHDLDRHSLCSVTELQFVTN